MKSSPPHLELLIIVVDVSPKATVILYTTRLRALWFRLSSLFLYFKTSFPFSLSPFFPILLHSLFSFLPPSHNLSRLSFLWQLCIKAYVAKLVNSQCFSFWGILIYTNLDTKTKCLSGWVDTIDIKQREFLVLEGKFSHLITWNRMCEVVELNGACTIHWDFAEKWRGGSVTVFTLLPCSTNINTAGVWLNGQRVLQKLNWASTTLSYISNRGLFSCQCS